MAGISKRVSGAWQNTSYGIRGTTTDTITTLPTTIYSDGTNATVSIKGNTTQTGTPTPDNPIMPEGTGERTGNLFDGVIEVGGLSPTTGAENTNNTKRRSGFISVEPSTNYGLSREITSSGSFFWVIAYDENKNIVTDATVSAQYSGVVVTGTDLTINQWTFTTTPTTKYIRWYVTVNNSYKNIMLNTGTTALPYEPYGVKIPISSANTTTPVYLGEVETTRKIKKLVLDGTETITEESANVYSISITDTVTTGTGLSTHFEYDSRVSAGQFRIEAGKAVFGYNDTLANFSTFLAAQYAAGTPVTIWYVLATEETAVVNEPLMCIGDYADEVSGVSIPTTDGANTLSVDTTVQPSEVSINYHGWHIGTVHEHTSGQWD